MKERPKKKKFAKIVGEEYSWPSRTKVPTTTVCKLKVKLNLRDLPQFWDCQKEIDNLLKSLKVKTIGIFAPIEAEITLVGVAKLSPKDHFDENIGKKVAKAKANIKLYNICKNIQKICLRHSLKRIRETTDILELFEYLEDNERAYLKEEKYEIRDRQ